MHVEPGRRDAIVLLYRRRMLRRAEMGKTDWEAIEVLSALEVLDLVSCDELKAWQAEADAAEADYRAALLAELADDRKVPA